MAAYLQKVNQLRSIFKFNGGFVASMVKWCRMEEVRIGEFKGQDEFGNKYYENKSFFLGRSRWVEYPDKVGYDYDGSMIPPEWHRWMQYIGDETPVEKPPKKRKWMQKYEENMSGTPQEYVPYSTTLPKIESWKPSKSS